ncbi:MAG: cupin domain-containing protein [Xylophilus ampelinus]
MRIHADFSRPVVVEPAAHRWVPSPQPGVERMMLDRIGGEQARATSLVRYAPGSAFPAHAHGGGEEILVLSGIFSDEGGDHPAGCYLRHPPGSAHAPSTAPGALVFVKLRQMGSDESVPVRIDTTDPRRWSGAPDRMRCLLFRDDRELVALERLAPARPLFDGMVAGAEILVVRGGLRHAGRILPALSWVRLPAGAYPRIAAGPSGATVYLKSGALSPDAGREPSRHGAEASGGRPAQERA